VILDYIKQQRPLIDTNIRSLINENYKCLLSINLFGDDILQKLEKFCVTGKFLRGVLVILGTELYGGKLNDNVYKLAALLKMYTFIKQGVIRSHYL